MYALRRWRGRAGAAGAAGAGAGAGAGARRIRTGGSGTTGMVSVCSSLAATLFRQPMLSCKRPVASGNIRRFVNTSQQESLHGGIRSSRALKPFASCNISFL
eukprot:745886-Hanusia_phi.AAC.2